MFGLPVTYQSVEWQYKRYLQIINFLIRAWIDKVLIALSEYYYINVCNKGVLGR